MSDEELAKGPAFSQLLFDDEKLALIVNITLKDIILPMPEGFSLSRRVRGHVCLHCHQFIRKCCCDCPNYQYSTE